MRDLSRLTKNLPTRWRRRIEPLLDLAGVVKEVQNPKSVLSMLPSISRGFFLREGRQDGPTLMISGHPAHFDWKYEQNFPEMQELYSRAKRNQWDAETALDWGIDVDPLNPELPLLPKAFFPLEDLQRETGLKLSEEDQRNVIYSVTCWLLSQFLHGEQGALVATAQVTESVPWLEGKLYGSTQVVDEGRHVEVFHRYLDTKLNKLYVINDNLFTILDALLTDSRWDMKFLGMQIMVEGLALGAFGVLYKLTSEPLLRSLLRYVIQDEARHVHYGVLALHRHIATLSEQDRREREDWAFEVALLMRNRFLLHEVFEEHFEGALTRGQWNRIVSNAKGLQEFRSIMFTRLIPNLKYIGLMSPRMVRHYERAGLMKYAEGDNATQLSADRMLDELVVEMS